MPRKSSDHSPTVAPMTHDETILDLIRRGEIQSVCTKVWDEPLGPGRDVLGWQAEAGEESQLPADDEGI